MTTLLYIYHGPTLGKGGNNPFGHTAIALTHSGLYSFGNSTTLGSSVTMYLTEQLKIREIWAVIIPINSEQAGKIMRYLAQFPTTRPNDGINLVTTCATRTGSALREAGLGNKVMVMQPETYGFPLSQYKMVRDFPHPKVVHLAQKSRVLPLFSEFNPSANK